MDNLETFLALKPRNTARSYRASINQFLEWLKRAKRKRHTGATVKDALEWLTGMKTLKASATISNRHGALSAYYAYLVATNQAKNNPFEVVNALLPRRQRKQVRPTATLPPSVVKILLGLPPRNTKRGLRDRALLAALFGGGLRRSEALALNCGDILVTPKGNLIMQLKQTKNGQIQTQPLRAGFAERVTELVSQRKTEGAENGDPLFVFYYLDGNPRGRICEKTLYRIFRRYAARAGVKAAPHAARAAAITKLLTDHWSLLDVKKFARHAALSTVEIYDHRRVEADEAPLPKFL